MRALLVANPAATTTSPQVRDVIAAALSSRCRLEVAATQRRGDGIALGAQAADDHLDLVVVLGGDGTVNEVVNGLMHGQAEEAEGAEGAEEAEGAGRVAQHPALAIVPGGHTNVLARSLGLPRDPVAATSRLLDSLARGSRRRIGLGRADERWFTFCAGLGVDAAVVARIERAREEGHRVHTHRYAAAAAAEFATSVWRRPGRLELTGPAGQHLSGVHGAFITNTAPWTYLGAWPVNPCPEASFDTGLDVFALTRSELGSTLGAVRSMLTPPVSSAPNGRGLSTRSRPAPAHGSRGWRRCHDLAWLDEHADRPLPFQVDGEYAGARDQVRVRAVPACLDLVL
jgi:diacylglycerol kinase family enzyme